MHFVMLLLQGLRYRFRLVNAGFLNCPLELSVDNHTLLVIASDGFDTKPMRGEYPTRVPCQLQELLGESLPLKTEPQNGVHLPSQSG